MKKIVLFGAASYGQRIKKWVEQYLKEEIIFCDNDAKKQNTEIDNVKVISFAELLKLYRKEEIDKIIIATRRIDEIIYQCSEENIDLKVLYYYDEEDNILKRATSNFADTVYSQDGEEIYLKSRFVKKCGSYVDIGANHPFRFSNTYWAYLKGWRGINIEPDIKNYKFLKSIKAEDINLNCGISNEESELNYYVFKEDALNTFCFREIENKENIIDVRKIPVRRLDSIFKEYNITHIDYMDIDVEGMELEVLESIDWEQVSIECILVEQRRMTLIDVINSDVYKFLDGKKYSPVSKYNRTVIYEKVTFKK